MDRQVKNKHYNQRKKVEPTFYRYLIFVFIITMIAGFCVLGFLYTWLENYEKSSAEGSMNIYFDNIQAGNYEEIYEE